MKELKSKHIVELFDLQKTGRFIYLVMEYCDGGDLAGYLRKRKVLEEAEVRQLIVQLGEALRILSNANFAHRDLKPQNLLLTTKPEEEPTLKLGDFGFARFVDPADLAETLCGSPLYMAPEILRYEKYDGRADLWSVGAIMYEMVFGRPPFRAQNHIQLLKVIEKSDSIPFTSQVFVSEEDPEHMVTISEQCKDLILGLLKKNPDERLTFEQFISHPFLASAKPAVIPETRSEETFETGTFALGPKQQQRGFSIPRAPRQRSISSAGLTASLRPERRSSLSASLQQQNVLQSAPAPPGPLTQSGGSFSTHEDAMFKEEAKLVALTEGFSIARPALVKFIQRDARLGLLLKEIAEKNFNLLDKTAENNKASFMETLQLFTVSAELFQDLLKSIKDSALPTFEPTNEGTRAMVLWLYANIRAVHEKISSLQKQMEESSIGIGLSITSSSVCSSTEPLQSISEIIYSKALKYGRDGGLKELLGHPNQANGLYSRSLFLLEILASPTKPSAFTEIKEPVASQQDLRVIQGYINVVQHRWNSLRSRPVAL